MYYSHNLLKKHQEQQSLYILDTYSSTFSFTLLNTLYTISFVLSTACVFSTVATNGSQVNARIIHKKTSVIILFIIFLPPNSRTYLNTLYQVYYKHDSVFHNIYNKQVYSYHHSKTEQTTPNN